MLKILSQTFRRIQMRFSGQLRDLDESERPLKRPAKRGRDRNKRRKKR